ncbi:histone H1B-like [Protobothrops mucrosquamatus]|uniref:histone H1B-like n=1 Tax=Protobothrops mucrosquamatus TaxID=103944 RepID=UPI0007757E17|nr:histone H1B-like [Protobothrops mucrosquamatus]
MPVTSDRGLYIFTPPAQQSSVRAFSAQCDFVPLRMVHEKRQGAPAETSTASTSTKETEKKKRVSGSLSQLILQVLEACNSRKGISLAALKKSLIEAGYNLTKNNLRLKRELRNLVSNGVLIRVTGSGVSGSFKFGKNQPPKPKKAAVKTAKGKRVPKKARKKQPAVHKPKGLQGRKPSNSGRKRQVNKRPAGKAR